MFTMLDPGEKILAVVAARKMFENWIKQEGYKIKITTPDKGCFFQAFFFCQAMKHLYPKCPAAFMGGSLSWPRIDLTKDDDGKILTHFSYLFEPASIDTMTAMAMGCMPEMHVWNYLPETEEIVDLQTKYLKINCEDMTPLKWSGADPPDYLWCPISKIPEGVHYRPQKEALGIIDMVYKSVFPKRR